MKQLVAIGLVFLILGGSLSALTHKRKSDTPDDAPFWKGQIDAATFQKETDERLTAAQKALDQMLAVKGKRNIENTLKLYDEILIQLDSASYQTDLIQNVHPDAGF